MPLKCHKAPAKVDKTFSANEPELDLRQAIVHTVTGSLYASHINRPAMI